MRVRVAAALLACVALGGCSSAKKAAPTVVPNGKVITASATPAASPTPSPLSPFEGDPGVQALRAWAAQAGRTINTGKYDDAALDALMTPGFATKMEKVFGTEVGYYYPGPLPFTPMTAPVNAATGQQINLCVVTGGYSQSPTTHKPAEVYEVSPMQGEVFRADGRWLVSGFHASTAFSCAGVKVPAPSW